MCPVKAPDVRKGDTFMTTTKTFKKMQMQGEKHFSLNQLADFNGPVKMLLFENYRNEYGHYGFNELDENFEIPNLDTLIEQTIKGNKTSKKLLKEIETYGWNDYEKDPTLMDTVDLIKTGVDSRALKGLKIVYQKDGKFMKHLDDLTEIQNYMNNYPDETSYLNAINKYRNKYYVVIGGNTRTAILIKICKDIKKHQPKNKSTKEKIRFALIDYSRLMSKLNCDMSSCYGENDEMIELHNVLDYAILQLLIFKDNERDRSNMTDGASLSGQASVARGLIQSQRFLTNQNDLLEIRDLELQTKPLWGEVSSLYKGWMLQSIAYDLAKHAQEDEGYDGKIYELAEIENFAKVLQTTIGAKTGTIKINDNEKISIKMPAKKIEEFCGINMKTMTIQDKEAFWNVVELATLLKEEQKSSAASYLSESFRTSFYNKKEDESWRIGSEESKEILKKVKDKVENDRLNQEVSKKVVECLTEMKKSANNLGVITVSNKVIDDLLTSGNAEQVAMFYGVC